jgi:hypothetical protein
MKAEGPVKTTLRTRSILGVIVAAAAVVRFWGFPGYFPQFWDEAKYICEVEKLIPYFSVNAGAFAFLKLGYQVFGLPSYAPIVCGIFGVLTVGGCYFVGTRVFPGQRRGVHLGLLMAALAALMPYLVRYSHHAFPEVFALCFFVWALVFYLARLNTTPRAAVGARQQRRWNSLVSVALLALVPACSFKFLLPTFILFLTLEFYLWRLRRRHLFKNGPARDFVIMLVAGTAFFVVIPFILALTAGYDGWFERARLLSEAHSSIGTMRLAAHVLYPIHLFHFCGIIFTACALAGIWIMFAEPPGRRAARVTTPAATILFLPFAVYLLFFGFLSHLQAARVYVLTVPFLIFTAAVFLLWLRDVRPRIGIMAMSAVLLLTLFSFVNICRDHLSKTTGFAEACHVIARQIQQGQIVYAGTMAQVLYGVYRSPYCQATYFRAEPPSRLGKIPTDPSKPPIVVIEDGADADFWLADRDKYDRPADMMEIRLMLADYHRFASAGELIFATEEHFTNSPNYYLEDIYSWQSFHDLQTLLANSRDSIFIYQLQPPAE